MEEDPTRICGLIVGLGEVEVLAVEDEPAGPAGVAHPEEGAARLWGCGGVLWSKSSALVRLVDLLAFGRPVRLVWRKRRRRCAAANCPVGSFTEFDEQIAPARAAWTDRARRWATVAVRRDGRPAADVAGELGCDWHMVNRAVFAWGEALLAGDCDQVGTVEALGLDETKFGLQGPWRTRRWYSSIVEGTEGKLLDIVPGRNAEALTAWLLDQPSPRGARASLGCARPLRPLSGTFKTALPQVGQVADPLYVIRLANNSIDEVRRRVQNDTLGHRGRKDDPLWRA